MSHRTIHSPKASSFSTYIGTKKLSKLQKKKRNESANENTVDYTM